MATENATPISTAAKQPRYRFTLRNELRKLSRHCRDALQMIHTGEPPKLEDPEELQREILARLPRGASSAELGVEIAARNLIDAIDRYLT